MEEVDSLIEAMVALISYHTSYGYSTYDSFMNASTELLNLRRMGDDEEFVVEEPKLDGAMTKIVAKKKTSSKKGGKGRATRDRESNKGAASAKTMRTFNQLLEANALDEAPVGIPTYTTIAAGPPSSGAPRKFCSVCGFPSPYTCSRCGMRFCCRKCNQIHSETRCLKMLG